MADVLIRGLDDDTIERLKRRAERAGRSLQSETKLILERAAGRDLADSLSVAAAWRRKSLKSKSGSAKAGIAKTDSVKALRQDRRR